LAFVDVNCVPLHNLGASVRILGILDENVKDAAKVPLHLVVECARALRNLSAHPSLQADLLALGAVDILVQSLKTTKGPEFAVEALGALANIAEEETCLAKMFNVCTQEVLAVLGRLSNEQAVVHQGCLVLSNLAVDQNLISPLMNKGAAHVILAAMNTFPEVCVFFFKRVYI